MVRTALTATLALATLSPLWAQASLAWNQPTRGVAVAVDAQRNVFTVDFDYNPAGDIALTKRDTDGNLLWTTGFNQTDNTLWEKAAWLDCDSQGRAVVCGTLMSGYSNPVNAASILMKFDTDGTLLWRQVFDSSFDGSSTRKCLVDAQDNIYVLGLGMGNAGLTTRVRKFAPDGVVVWTWQDSQGIGAPQNLKFTPDGGLLVMARGTVGSTNGFAKVNGDGTLAWSLTGIISIPSCDAAGDAQGGTYLVHGENAFNGGMVLRKLDAAGATQWSTVHAIGGTRVQVGSDNLPLICGSPNYNGTGAAFLKCTTSGAPLWSNMNADGALNLLTQSMFILDGQNNGYLAAASFGAGMEMAVCRVNADGSSGWTFTMPSGGAVALDRDSANAIYLVGGHTAKIQQGPPALPAPVVDYVWGPACNSRLEWNAVPGALDYQVWGASMLGQSWQELGVTGQLNWSLPCEAGGMGIFRVVARGN